MRFITLVSYIFSNSTPILKLEQINYNLCDLQLLTIFKTLLSLIQRLEVPIIGPHTFVKWIQYHVVRMIARMLELPKPLVASLLKLSIVEIAQLIYYCNWHLCPLALAHSTTDCCSLVFALRNGCQQEACKAPKNVVNYGARQGVASDTVYDYVASKINATEAAVPHGHQSVLQALG